MTFDTGSEALANSNSGVVAICATGAKSATTSNGTFLCSHFCSTAEVSITTMVWPSGTALATESRPTTPPAPGRFSTTHGCLSRSASWAAKMRPMVSTPPPAAIGTTRVTGACRRRRCAEAPIEAAGAARPRARMHSFWVARIVPSRRDHICCQERSAQLAHRTNDRRCRPIESGLRPPRAGPSPGAGAQTARSFFMPAFFSLSPTGRGRGEGAQRTS